MRVVTEAKLKGISALFEDGVSRNEIARRLGMNARTVGRCIARLGLVRENTQTWAELRNRGRPRVAPPFPNKLPRGTLPVMQPDDELVQCSQISLRLRAVSCALQHVRAVETNRDGKCRTCDVGKQRAAEVYG